MNNCIGHSCFFPVFCIFLKMICDAKYWTLLKIMTFLTFRKRLIGYSIFNFPISSASFFFSVVIVCFNVLIYCDCITNVRLVNLWLIWLLCSHVDKMCPKVLFSDVTVLYVILLWFFCFQLFVCIWSYTVVAVSMPSSALLRNFSQIFDQHFSWVKGLIYCLATNVRKMFKKW